MKDEKITQLKYSNTNTYLIEGDAGSILFDTGWAGTFQALCAEFGRLEKDLSRVRYLVISHFHPDHYGIAQEIADCGPVILAADVQKDRLHASDAVFEKDARTPFTPIRDEAVQVISLRESRQVLEEMGIAGELLHTPGHSEDSISLILDQGVAFVGDLNPLYELELHRGTQIGESWEKVLSHHPKAVYYGHAKTATLEADTGAAVRIPKADPEEDTGRVQYYELTTRIVKYIDKGYSPERIAKKTGADPVFIEDLMRMYLTHPGISTQGILDRIEIKGK
ncbi:MAG: MBL fold metallo-hydrolase [Lachnospiraceae bacterium]|nr:MBL fold metallo-hydrolase [Lachnospiraceae bacterium]